MTESNRKVHPVWLGAIATIVVLGFNLFPILAFWKLIDSNTIAFLLASLAYNGLQLTLISWIAFRAGGTSWATWVLPVILLMVGVIQPVIIAELGSSPSFRFNVGGLLASCFYSYAANYGLFVAAAMILRMILAGNALPSRFPAATLKRIGCLMSLFALVLAIDKFTRSLFTTFYTPYSYDIMVNVLLFGRSITNWDSGLLVMAVFVAAAYPIQRWKWLFLQRLLVLVLGSLAIVALDEYHTLRYLADENGQPIPWREAYDANELMRVFACLACAGLLLSSFYAYLFAIHLAGYRWHVKPSKSEKNLNEESFSLDLANSEAKTLIDEKLY